MPCPLHRPPLSRLRPLLALLLCSASAACSNAPAPEPTPAVPARTDPGQRPSPLDAHTPAPTPATAPAR